PFRSVAWFANFSFFASALLLPAAVSGATITVNGTADVAADDGQCTLREAIIAANNNAASGVTLGECSAGTAGFDTIQFSIAGTIGPTSALPAITEPIFIDGYSAPGSLANTHPVGMGLNTVLTIELNLAGPGGARLVIANPAAGSTIQGLVINRSGLAAIAFGPGSTGNVVQGCFIGTNPAGSAAGPGNFDGIVFGSSGNTVGGTSAAARNLISGNADAGINFGALPGEDNNVIQGNLIGTNAAGTAAVANGTGVAILEDRTSNATIGGSVAGSGNVISGNTTQGIVLGGNTLPNSLVGATIQGNFIGTDVTGTAALGNGFDGII